MAIREAFIAELKHESSQTRKMLEKVPFDKKDWRPHQKSMSLGRLATHVADSTHWISDILQKDDFDFAKDYNMNPAVSSSTEELLTVFQTNLDKAIQDLMHASDAEFEKKWTVKRAGELMFQSPKKVSIRAWGFSHVIHHRGQLSVYLRLLDVAVPGMYGPSADERP